MGLMLEPGTGGDHSAALPGTAHHQVRAAHAAELVRPALAVSQAEAAQPTPALPHQLDAAGGHGAGGHCDPASVCGMQ